MPYSDNLYSANDDDESDNESFSNELSPTDGFFSPNRIQPNVMIADPSLQDCKSHDKQEDKVLIPRNEGRTESDGASRAMNSPTLGQMFPSQNNASAQSNHPSSSRTSYTPSSPLSYHRTDHIFSERTPSMQGPPPAYTPSSPTFSEPSHINRRYSTFQPHQLEQGIAPSREPESMGRPADQFDGPSERTPLSNTGVKRSSRRRIIIRKALFVALVFAVVTGIMTMFLNLGKSDSPKLPDGNSPDKDLPEGWKPPSSGRPIDSSGPYCASATYKKEEIIHEFSLNTDLLVLQTTHEGDGSKSNSQNVKTAGEIKLRRLLKDSKYGSKPFISLDINVSDPSLEVLRTWDDHSHTLSVSTPRYAQLSSSGFARGGHCISLEITVWLPEDATLSKLGLASINLDLTVLNDVKAKVTETSEFSTIASNINFPGFDFPDLFQDTEFRFDSRHITVETVSGNIKGIYPLYDYLKIGSQSGDIKTGIYPQPVLPSAPEPADLEISTASGNIQVNLPVQIPRYTPPPRDYITRVSSTSGHISGGYFLGSLGSFKSTSGDIKMTVLPVIQSSGSTNPDEAPKVSFESWTVSGKHEIEILDPVFIALLPTKQPDGHHTPSPTPYIPIGDDDLYHLLPPNFKQDLNTRKSDTEAKTKTAKKWRTLQATHRSSSGKVDVYYPVAWEGTVSAKTVSGNIVVEGDGLKMISYKKGWAYKEALAGKGVDKEGEGSSVSMTNIAGNLEFVVGEKGE